MCQGSQLFSLHSLCFFFFTISPAFPKQVSSWCLGLQFTSSRTTNSSVMGWYLVDTRLRKSALGSCRSQGRKHLAMRQVQIPDIFLNTKYLSTHTTSVPQEHLEGCLFTVPEAELHKTWLPVFLSYMWHEINLSGGYPAAIQVLNKQFVLQKEWVHSTKNCVVNPLLKSSHQVNLWKTLAILFLSIVELH